MDNKRGKLNRRANFWYLLPLIAVVIFYLSACASKNYEMTDFQTLKERIDEVSKEEPVYFQETGERIWLAEGKWQKKSKEGTGETALTSYGGETTYFKVRLFEEERKELIFLLRSKGIQPKLKLADSGATIGGIASMFLPLLLFGALLFFLLKRAGGAQDKAQLFGKSKARLSGGKSNVRFPDVAGCEEAKQELLEVVDFLQNPKKFTDLGAKIPKGVLLVGPPGTGKTLIAKAVAGEAGVPFFSISGSEFVEMFVGVGAARVRDLFEQAKRNSPCIIFVDEIDAVGRQRGSGLGGSHDEREQTLNQILVEMDGFNTDTNVIVMSATNRPDILDPALLRPGRFDRQVVLDLPDSQGRLAILNVHAKGKPLASSVSLEKIAKQTPGFSGADLANLLNEAAILAARGKKEEICQIELEEAIDRVIAGPKKSMLISPREKEIAAYHEAGHALVGLVLPNVDPLHKITIVARGRMGGYTRFLPEEDRRIWTKSQLKEMMAAALGGYVAEEIKLGEVSTGAENDLEQVGKIARKMVTRYGMAEDLPPQAYGEVQEMIFLGKEIHERQNYGGEKADKIDKAIDELVTWARNLAKEIIAKYKENLEKVAEKLKVVETLEGEELEKVFEGVEKNKWPPKA